MENCFARQNILPNRIHLGPKSVGRSIYRRPGMQLYQELNMTKKKAVSLSWEIFHTISVPRDLVWGVSLSKVGWWRIGRGKDILLAEN